MPAERKAIAAAPRPRSAPWYKTRKGITWGVGTFAVAVPAMMAMINHFAPSSPQAIKKEDSAPKAEATATISPQINFSPVINVVAPNNSQPSEPLGGYTNIAFPTATPIPIAPESDPISFQEFGETVKKLQEDYIELLAFRKEKNGKLVNWEGLVSSVSPSETHSTFTIRHPNVRGIASFVGMRVDPSASLKVLTLHKGDQVQVKGILQCSGDSTSMSVLNFTKVPNTLTVEETKPVIIQPRKSLIPPTPDLITFEAYAEIMQPAGQNVGEVEKLLIRLEGKQVTWKARVHMIQPAHQNDIYVLLFDLNSKRAIEARFDLQNKDRVYALRAGPDGSILKVTGVLSRISSEMALKVTDFSVE